MDLYERRILLLQVQFQRVSLKVIVNFLAVFLGSNLLMGCDSETPAGSVDGKAALSEEGARRVIGELEAFLETDERETITITKEDAGRILSILRPQSAPKVETAEKVISEKMVSKRTVSAPGVDMPEVKPDSGDGDMAAQSVVKGSPAVSALKTGIAVKKSEAKKEDTKKVAESDGGVDKIPDNGADRPEGFEDKLVDPTTGFEFEWSSKKGVWLSTAFADYLKGSSKQNESFCWLLTQNSSGVDKGAIPDGWVYLPLGDRKSIAIAEESRTGEIQASVGKVDALPAKSNVVKSEKSEPAAPGESVGPETREMKSAAAAKMVDPKHDDSPANDAPLTGATVPTPLVPAKSMPVAGTVEKNGAPAVEEAVKKVVSTPASIPPQPVEEPARFRPVSEVLPVGATLPDGRRLVAVPQYETRQYVNPGQPAARPVLRAVPARKVDVQAPSQGNEDGTTNATGASGQTGVPSANSKPVVRPTITIKSRRIGNLWKNKQEDQPVQPKQ